MLIKNEQRSSKKEGLCSHMDMRFQLRKEHLVTKLESKLLPLRHDSRLCFCFIYDQLGDDWCVDRVVEECATMHWLHNYTTYPFQLREAYLYFSNINMSGRDVHEFIKHNVQPQIKTQIILFHGGIPNIWPWLQVQPDLT